MPQGSIKKLVHDRGFGFISAERGDIFFHCSQVQEAPFDELEIGQTVEYELGEGKKGPCAFDVRVLSSEPVT